MQSETEVLDALVEDSLRLAIQKLSAKEGFSLVGLCLNKANERNGVVISANDDADMVKKAKDWLREMQAVSFALIGEGNVPADGQMVPVFILYAQGLSDSQVKPFLLPYSREPWEDGERIGVGEWIPRSPMPESWLP